MAQRSHNKGLCTKQEAAELRETQNRIIPDQNLKFVMPFYFTLSLYSLMISQAAACEGMSLKNSSFIHSAL